MSVRIGGVVGEDRDALFKGKDTERGLNDYNCDFVENRMNRVRRSARSSRSRAHCHTQPKEGIWFDRRHAHSGRSLGTTICRKQGQPNFVCPWLKPEKL